MPFSKVDFSTNDVLPAEQVNAIQDAIIEHEGYLDTLNRIPRNENASTELLRISTDKHNYYDITSGIEGNEWLPVSSDIDGNITLSHTLNSSGTGSVDLSSLRTDITSGTPSTLRAITFRINRGNSSFVSQNPLEIKICDGLTLYQQNSYRLMLHAYGSDGTDTSPTNIKVITDNTEFLLTIVRGYIDSMEYTAIYFDDMLFWEYSGELLNSSDYSGAHINTGVMHLNSVYVNAWNMSDYSKSDVAYMVQNMVEKFKIDRNVTDVVILSNFLRDLEYKNKRINAIIATLSALENPDEFANITTDLANLKSSYDTLQSKNKDVENRVFAAETAIDALNTTLGTLTEELDAVNGAEGTS